MATTHQKLSGALVARMEERFVPFRRNAFAHRTWFFVTLAFVLATHAALLIYFLHRDSETPVETAKVEETPVEVIVEPPKPPEKQPAPQPPKPAVKQEIEKPASSAPRAPSETKVETQQTQKDTHAPKAPTPPKDGKPEPAKEAASPSNDPAEPDKSEAETEKKEVLDKEAEALDKAVPEPPRRPRMKVAKAKPPARLRKEQTAMDQLAGDSELPDFSFARPTKKSPVYGGTEDSRYLAIVYGMIMSNRRPIGVADPNGNVTIAFDVDDDGRLTGLGFVRRSGYPEIDAEAAAAIRRASPFPPPPAGAPHGLIATIDFTEAGPTLTMGRGER